MTARRHRRRIRVLQDYSRVLSDTLGTQAVSGEPRRCLVRWLLANFGGRKVARNFRLNGH